MCTRGKNSWMWQNYNNRVLQVLASTMHDHGDLCAWFAERGHALQIFAPPLHPSLKSPRSAPVVHVCTLYVCMAMNIIAQSLVCMHVGDICAPESSN